MIEITNVKKSGEIKLGFKGKDDKTIDFCYGKTIDETMVDKETLENSMKNGILAGCLYKGWAIKGKINVNNKIVGTPQTFKQVTAQEVKTIEPKIELSENKDLIVNEVGISMEPKKVEEVKQATIKSDVVETNEVKTEEKKGRGRPRKATTEVNAEVKEPNTAVENKVEVKENVVRENKNDEEQFL
jgi:hypothetical protein